MGTIGVGSPVLMPSWLESIASWSILLQLLHYLAAGYGASVAALVVAQGSW